MDTDPTFDIATKVQELRVQRHNSLVAWSEKYDHDTYYPALRLLQARCGDVGHRWLDDGYSIGGTHKFLKCLVCRMHESRELTSDGVDHPGPS